MYSPNESAVDEKRAPGEASSYQTQPAHLGFVDPGTAYAPPPYSAEADPKPGQNLERDQESIDNYDPMYLKISDCTNASLRAAFISKVYALLFLQLLITFGIVSVFSFVNEVKDFVSGSGKYADSDTWWILLIVALCVYLLVYIVIVCCTAARRKVPYNYIFLIIFSLATGYMLGAVASLFDTMAVVQAMAATLTICVCMTFFGCQERIPLGGIFIAAFSLSISLLTFSILALFTYNPWSTTIYATLAVALFSLILLIDTYLIMNGGRHDVFMEEYVFCSLILYLDIINIFIYMLMILGGSSRN